MPRADVWVFDATNLGTGFGGTPVRILSFFADTPRALATDGTTVYVAAFHSGNQTAGDPRGRGLQRLHRRGALRDARRRHGAGRHARSEHERRRRAGARDRPDREVRPADAASGSTCSAATGTPSCRSTLPDRDVFAFNANTLRRRASLFADVGTILFNMAREPGEREDLRHRTPSRPNLTRFEGPGVFGGSTVQGHVSEARITVIDPAHRHRRRRST